MKLENGSVLPHGLLDLDTQSNVAGFNKTHSSNSLRAGIIVKSYAKDDKGNNSKLTMEYDVLVIEQDNNRAITAITYKNCLSSEGLGSIADFFEVRLRNQKSFSGKAQGKDFKGQDGALVLLLCLDGSSEKGIIIGALPHPDRKTKISGSKHTLSGEFNGLSIDVKDDGSANLTFKGATDNKGAPKDASQGPTTIDIEMDGTVQFKNKGVTQRLEKAGNILLKNIGMTTLETTKAIKIETKDEFSLKATKDATLEMLKMIVKASGSATFTVQALKITSETDIEFKGTSYKLEADMIKMEGTDTKIKGSMITLDGMTFVGGSGGTPAVTLQTQFLGVGFLGFPVLSQAIGPFSTKVFLA